MNSFWELLISLISAIDSARKAVISEEELAKIPPHRRIEKPAAAGFIVPKKWGTYLEHLRELPVLLGRSSRTGWLEVLGGGLQSAEESIMEKMFAGATFPNLIDPKTKKPSSFGGAFYHIQTQSILASGQMAQLTYNTKGGEHDQMAALREVVEEGLVDGVKVVTSFSNSVNVGVAFSPFNRNLRPLLEERFPGMYDGEEPWAQIVVQRGFLATVDVEHPQLPEFAHNSEIKGLVWLTLEELVALAKVKVGREVGLPQEIKDEVLRNSVPLHFLKWFIEYLYASGVQFTW